MVELTADGAQHLPALFSDRIGKWSDLFGRSFKVGSAGSRLPAENDLAVLAADLLTLPALKAALRQGE